MKKKILKRNAHAVTYLAGWWILFSAWALFNWIDGRYTLSNPNSWASIVIWSIHIVLVCVALYLWRSEKPRETIWIGEDDELIDAKPEDIDLVKERATLKRLVILQAIGTIFMVSFAWLSSFSANPKQSSNIVLGVAILSGCFMLFSITAGLIRYFVLSRKVKASNQ